MAKLHEGGSLRSLLSPSPQTDFECGDRTQHPIFFRNPLVLNRFRDEQAPVILRCTLPTVVRSSGPVPHYL